MNLKVLFFSFSFSFPGRSPQTTIFPLLDMFSWAWILYFPALSVNVCLHSFTNLWIASCSTLPDMSEIPLGPEGCLHELSSLEALTWKQCMCHFVCELSPRSVTAGLLHHLSFGEKFCYHGSRISWDDSTSSPGSSANHFTYHCLWSWLLPSTWVQKLQAPLPVEMISTAHLLLPLKARPWIEFGFEGQMLSIYISKRYPGPYFLFHICKFLSIIGHTLCVCGYLVLLSGRVGKMLIWFVETTNYSFLLQFPGCFLGY